MLLFDLYQVCEKGWKAWWYLHLLTQTHKPWQGLIQASVNLLDECLMWCEVLHTCYDCINEFLVHISWWIVWRETFLQCCFDLLISFAMKKCLQDLGSIGVTALEMMYQHCSQICSIIAHGLTGESYHNVWGCTSVSWSQWFAHRPRMRCIGDNFVIICHPLNLIILAC